MQTLKDKIMDLLVSQNILSKERLTEALKVQKDQASPLRNVLLKGGFIEESKLISVLSKSLYLPTLNLSKYHIDKSLTKFIPEKISRQYILIPVSCIGQTLTVAVADPLNIFALDDLRLLTGLQIDMVIAQQKDILKTIDTLYNAQETPITDFQKEQIKDNVVPAQDAALELDRFKGQAQAPTIIKLVDAIIMDALKRRASDIHIEPEEDDLRIRFRIDGELVDVFSIPLKIQNALIARIKLVSGLNLTESRIPQDGRFKVKYANKEADFRVSSLPITCGQKLVLRILDKSMLEEGGFESLGFSEESLKLLKEAIQKPYGMLLVTGPTGSGKSTTLYSVLKKLNTVEKNIITIEDPIEYQVEGITQIQVNPEIGLTFASGLRSLLRQSPDIILVGEIRDSETADIAVKAALTGQLVMSTLHTNNAIGAVTRLMDMGIQPFLVASSIVMVCAQRLLRLNCSSCREEYQPSEVLLKELGINKEVKFFRGKGCSRCSHSGFYGRQAVLEILILDKKIKEMIISGCSFNKIEEYAVKNLAMKILRAEALLKAQDGLTTLEEALRITTEE